MISQNSNNYTQTTNNSYFEQRLNNQYNNSLNTATQFNRTTLNSQNTILTNQRSTSSQTSNIPITKIQDLSTQSNHSRFNSQENMPLNQNLDDTEKILNRESENGYNHSEERIGATSNSQEIIDSNTEEAIKIAKELSLNSITQESDFETPTFMRKKEESQRLL